MSKNSNNLLSLNGSEEFRKYLIAKNLQPYKTNSIYSQFSAEKNYETKLSDLTPLSLPDLTDTKFEYASKATIINQFTQINKIDASEIISSNAGAVTMQQQGSNNNSKTPEYTSSSGKLEIINEFFIDASAVINRFTPQGGFSESYISTDIIIPKQNGSSSVYPNFSTIEKNLTSFAQKDGTINKFKPLNGYMEILDLETNIPGPNEKNEEYPNYSNIDKKSWKEYQTAASAINKFTPSDGYINQIFLNLNTLKKNNQSQNEYQSSSIKNSDLIKQTQKELAINKYIVEDGEVSVYFNKTNTLPKTNGFQGQYKNTDLFNLDVSLYEKQKASSINTYSPNGGYTYQAELKLIPPTRNQLGEYNYSEIDDNVLIKKTQDKVLINKYKPTGGLYGVYTNTLITLEGNGDEQYPNFSRTQGQVWKEYQNAAFSINKFVPEGGTSETITLNLSKLSKNGAGSAQYPSNIKSDSKLTEETKNGIAINRYTALNSDLSVYVHNLKILKKNNGGSQEYTRSFLDSSILTKELQNDAAAINIYSPNGGYEYQVELKLITPTKNQLGEYNFSKISDEELIKKTKEKFVSNKYKPTGGLYGVYTNTIFTLEGKGNDQYPNFSDSENQTSKEYQIAAFSINKFVPEGGTSETITLNLSKLSKNGAGSTQYPSNIKSDSKLTEETKNGIAINKYTALNSDLSVYVHNLKILKKNNGGSQEYTRSFLDSSILTKELQNEAASINKFMPNGGYNYSYESEVISTKQNNKNYGEYPSGIKNDTKLIEETKTEIAVNRYAANNGDLNFYTNSVNILKKYGGGSLEYVNSEQIILPIIQKLQKEAAALNKFAPLEGYQKEISLFLQTLPQNDNQLGEYSSSVIKEKDILNRTKNEILINRYQANGGIYNLHSVNLISLPKLEGGTQEYQGKQLQELETSIENQTYFLTINRYGPDDGYQKELNLNLVSLSKISNGSNLYPNNLQPVENLILNTKKEIALNRYTSTNGELTSYESNTNVLKKLDGSIQEYDIGANPITELNKLSQNEAASSNRYIPNDGYTISVTIDSTSLSKNGDDTNEYPNNLIEDSDLIENTQKELAINKYIAVNGQLSVYSPEVTTIKGNTSGNYPNTEELIPDIPTEIKQTETINRYAPNEGFNLVYNATANILNKNVYPTKEYPNFIIPDEALYSSNLVNISSLINGNTSALGNPQDSYLQQLSVRFLAESFRDRIDREIQKETIGRVNLQAFSDPFSLSLLASGKQPLVSKNYTITVPDGIFDQASYLIQKFSGTYIPVSPIEGEYFTTYPENEKTKIGRLVRQVLGVFSKPATPTNRSEKFLGNTGSGQKSVLFSSLGKNIYRPKYDNNKTQVGQAIDNFFDALGNPLGIGDNSIGNLYVPYDTEDIQNLSNPISLDEIGKTFEGPDLNMRNFGLKSLPYNEDTDPSGGFSWTQQSTIDLAGKYVSLGGLQGPTSSEWQGNVQDKFNKSRSDILSFRENTLLNKTQKIIDETPISGAKRLIHVGNAINQTSKVFNDGYKEMTKGSKVRKYVNKGGVEVGEEYGRVFTKDIPYLTYNNLQSTIANSSGLETNGNIRKFTNSVVDSTYNLNIAPTFGQDSTNIKDGKVKKYMFSIENLAWRNTDEYNTLPDCEKGPNGGRVMWFPPYGLKIGQETSSPTFNSTNFLGRPEPIYTYENTKRSGSVTWQILVDHPSVTDIVLKYELNKPDPENTATNVINSFFSGLKKYDIYELAKKYSTVSLTTLETAYQNLLQSNQTSPEVKQSVANEIGPQSDTQTVNQTQTSFSKDFLGYSFFFPISANTNNNYYIVVADYIIELNGAEGTSDFRDSFINEFLYYNLNILTSFLSEISQVVTSESSIVEVTIKKTNVVGPLVIDSGWEKTIENFFMNFEIEENKKLIDFKDKSFKLKFDNSPSNEIIPIGEGDVKYDKVTCTDDAFGELDIINPDYTVEGAFCRSYTISNVSITPNPKKTENNQDNLNSSPNPQSQFGQKPKPQIDPLSQNTGISKKIIRELLTETNYFEVLKKDQSFIYDTIKTKFKFFNPAFHSMTPEGLNSRLVFLNQCVRPGKTLSVKQENGESITTDSYNTNFGTPPILVLRVGDFYHTKIVPTNLSITYENLWDYNPEGIGFQPMIAEVTLGYDMIGGHGLSGPVDRLQNALSFNYYANTEMYDERAVETEDTTPLDNALVSSIYNNEPLPVINNVGDVENDLGNTIGEILESTPFTNGVQTGTIQYKTIFNQFIQNTRNYFQETLNVYETIINQYNKGIYQQFTNQRHFYDGTFLNQQTPINAKLIGKPVYYQNVIQDMAENYSNRVNSEDSIILKLQTYSGAVDTQTFDKIVTNYKNLINSTASSNFKSLSTSSQNISDTQLKITLDIEKLDFICFSGDAKVLNDGSVKFYFLTGTSENGKNSSVSLVDDYTTVMKDISGFTENTKGILTPLPANVGTGLFTNYQTLTTFTNSLDVLAYSIFSDVILNSDKLKTFVENLTKGVESQTVSTILEGIIQEKWVNLFTNEKTAEKNELDAIKQLPTIKEKINYNPKDNASVSLTDKERKFIFSTNGSSSPYQGPFDKIKSKQNTNNDPITYNGKKQYNG